MGQSNSCSFGCLFSLLGLGLFIAGIAGLVEYFGYGEQFLADEVFQSGFAFVEEKLGSLLIPASASAGLGLLLLILGSTSSGGRPSNDGEHGYKGMMITCHKCGQKNPAYAALCSNCRTRLSLTND